MVGCLGNRVLFRGHIVRRADSLFLVWRAVAPEHLGDAEVGDFHLAGLVEQQVFRLDVAVDDGMVCAYCSASQMGGTMAKASFDSSLRVRRSCAVHAVNILHQQVK